MRYLKDKSMFKKLLLVFLIFCSFQLQAKKYDLCICSMFQNEAPYMKEWIEFHRLVGVQHFWLYNNNSTDNYKEVLRPYIKAGIVDLIEWPSEETQDEWRHHTYDVQVGAFNHAINLAKKKTKWLAILDLDEFVFSPIEDNLVKVLNRYFDRASGVRVNWQLFGTSHVGKIQPHELMMEKLVLKADPNFHRNFEFKSIVKPDRVEKCDNPHGCKYKEGYDLNGSRNRWSGKTGVYIDKIRINHYWTRDEYFLNQVKLPRYQKWNAAEAIANEAKQLNEVHDGTILRFAGRLRKAMTSKKIVRY